MKSVKNIIVIAALLILALVGGFFWGSRMDIFKTYEESSSEAMLEKISKVFKLVAVEAQVSEIYDYKQYRYWDIGPLRKKAMVRVTAKLSIGYDFEKLNVNIDESSRVIRITNFPNPEILSVDHDVDYYDMDEGWFNSFSGADLTKLNSKAKEYTINAVKKSDVYLEAEQQKEEIMGMLSEIFELSGWKLEVEGQEGRLQG